MCRYIANDSNLFQQACALYLHTKVLRICAPIQENTNPLIKLSSFKARRWCSEIEDRVKLTLFVIKLMGHRLDIMCPNPYCSLCEALRTVADKDEENLQYKLRYTKTGEKIMLCSRCKLCIFHSKFWIYFYVYASYIVHAFVKWMLNDHNCQLGNDKALWYGWICIQSRYAEVEVTLQKNEKEETQFARGPLLEKRRA